MRIHVTFIDRVGVTQEILSLLGSRNLNLDAVEMIPPNVYIDAPALSQAVLDELHDALLQVTGVQTVELVDVLPGQRRRLQLQALLAAMSDPVLSVDASGHVLLATPTLVNLLGREPAGEPLDQLFADPHLTGILAEKGFRLPMCEVTLQGQAFLLEATPIHGEPEGVVGGLLMLYPPKRIGERLASLLHSPSEGPDALQGESEALAYLKARLRKVASLDAPVLIRGETGTGKELVARACHTLSQRRESSFLALNCAALPENLAESELFGYSAGAFTGAQRGGKPGLLELADGGTVFLDEVGEMSPYLQVKLLRFLNDGSFRRVGGGGEVRVNVRVLCATHRNLENMVADGTFREDLYYRLNVLNLTVPPLRERGMDILLLAEHFLRQACAQIQRSPCRLSSATHPLLLSNGWSGNVRQLQNVIFRAAAICEGATIDCDDLELAGTALNSQHADTQNVTSLEAAIQGFEKSLLEKLYVAYPSTRQLASRLRTSHTAIGQRLRKYGIAHRPA